jgi:hypothetical protein
LKASKIKTLLSPKYLPLIQNYVSKNELEKPKRIKNVVDRNKTTRLMEYKNVILQQCKTVYLNAFRDIDECNDFVYILHVKLE